MTTYKLKVHISGQNDFEAEGDKESVERQFAAFTDLVRTAMANSREGNTENGALPVSLAKNIRTDEHSIFLATVPATAYPAADALLLILLAYKLSRKQDVVSGNELVASLKKSGMKMQRIDRALGPYLGGTQALVTKMGIRRGVKYKLTERGVKKARELAQNS
jgi:hypothetical protein